MKKGLQIPEELVALANYVLRLVGDYLQANFSGCRRLNEGCGVSQRNHSPRYPCPQFNSANNVLLS
ncbi:MAG: hypothetical protein ACXADX_16775, partial [Candidatus Hodarchaeales archaeon]